MTVVVVVHLRAGGGAGGVGGAGGLRGWVEEVATGIRTPVNGDDDLLAHLRELAGGGPGAVGASD